MIGKQVRSTARLVRYFAVIGEAAASYFFTVWLRGKSSSISARADWMCRYSRRLLVVLNVQVERHGVLPVGGLLAANHLSYLDILVLGAAQPMVFLSKSEVRHWPLVGYLTDCAGTLFIRRDKKSDVARFDEAFARVVNAEVVLGIFPEGTTTDSHRVLPFHASLFGSAAKAQWPVTPAWIGYETPHGSVENEVCYWGDMTFFPHFLHLITLDKIKATIVYGTPVTGEPDRKQIARQLHRQVCAMAGQHRPSLLNLDKPHNVAVEPRLPA